MKDLRDADTIPNFKINPLVDLPGTKVDASDTTLRVDDLIDDTEDEGLHLDARYHDVNSAPHSPDEYFGYLFKNKLYRWLREGFLVSQHARIHRAGFRSRYGVYQERSRHLASFPWIIHPYSTFRWCWEIIVTLALLVTLIRQPVLLSYMSESLTGSTEIIFSCLFAALFFVDIILNFRTGIVSQQSDAIILDPTLISRRYLSTWFIIDLLSTLPYDSVFYLLWKEEHVNKKALDYFKYIRLLELLKLFRLSRVIRYVTRMQEAYVMNSLYIRVVNLHIVIFFTLHWIACLHYLIADMMNPPQHRKPLSWVTRLDLWDKPVFIKYINSVIRALSNMACLGYGMEVPREPEDIICTCMSIIVGATFFALFVGNLSSILINMDVAQKKYAEVLNQVLEYMRFKQIPKELQNRVILYYEQRYRRNFFNEHVILANVSDVIRQELQMYNCRSLVEEVPLFQGLPQAIIQGIVARLKFEVYLPQDIIISANTFGDSMYFIEHGAVSVLAPSGRAVAHLRDGDFFGELALITEERRNATVVATSFCDVYRLERWDFEEVVEGYPEIYSHLIQLAEERAQELSKEPRVEDIYKKKKGLLDINIQREDSKSLQVKDGVKSKIMGKLHKQQKNKKNKQSTVAM